MGGGLSRATPRRHCSTNSDWPKDFSCATAVTIAEKGAATGSLERQAAEASLRARSTQRMYVGSNGDAYLFGPTCNSEGCIRTARAASLFCERHGGRPADSALNATRMKISHPHAEFVLPTSAAYSATTTSATSPCQSPSQEQALRDKPSEVVNKAISLLAQSDPEWFAEASADFWPTLQRTDHHGA